MKLSRLALVVAGFPILSVGLVSHGRPARQSPTPPFVTTGGFFAFSVPDLQKSVAWYTDTLGLHVVMQPPKQDKAAFAVLEGGGLIVELVQLDDAVPLKAAAPAIAERQFVHGIFKAGVVVADFDALMSALKSRGGDIAYGPYAARENQRANVIIRDNAGNLIQFFGTGPDGK